MRNLTRKIQGLHIAMFCALAASCMVIIGGCTVMPTGSGFHKKPDEKAAKAAMRFVVWSNHPGAGNHVIGILQKAGATVVERARLQEVFNEQKIRLSHTPDDDADVLRVGRLIGADRVIFVEVTVNSAHISRGYVDQGGGFYRSDTVYHPTVAVRSINVESSEILWSGTASYPKAIKNPEQAVIYLAEAAIAYAICPIEDGYAPNSLCEKDSNTLEKSQAYRLISM